MSYLTSGLHGRKERGGEHLGDKKKRKPYSEQEKEVERMKWHVEREKGE